MIECWYDVYEGAEKRLSTQNKAEAIAHVLGMNIQLRTKIWTFRLRREQVNQPTVPAQPASDSDDS